MRDLIDIIDRSQICEAVGDDLLYHGTDPDAAVAILHSGKIEGRTDHRRKIPIPSKEKGMRDFDVGFRPSDSSDDRVRGISLTRDPRFARKWKSGQGVVFVLDRNKIAQRHRMVKVAFYRQADSDKSEAEEFLVGDLKDIENYIVRIEMARETAEALEEIDADYPDDEYKQYSALLRHSKLVVDDRNWHPVRGTRI